MEAAALDAPPPDYGALVSSKSTPPSPAPSAGDDPPPPDYGALVARNGAAQAPAGTLGNPDDGPDIRSVPGYVPAEPGSMTDWANHLRPYMQDDPDAGSVLPFKGNEQDGITGLAVPNSIRSLGRGVLDLLQGPETGAVTPEATMALTMGVGSPVARSVTRAPMAVNPLMRQAADTILKESSDPAAVKAAVAAGPEETIPDSPQTLGMLTNDSGVKNLESVVRTQNDGVFRDIDNARNSAQTRALESVVPADASPEDAAAFHVNRLTQLQDARDLDAQAGQAPSAVPTATMDDAPAIGAGMRQEITSAMAPQRDALAAQDQGAQSAVQAAFDQVDHGLTDRPDATVAQQIGATQTGLLTDAAAAAKVPVDEAYQRLRDAAPDLSIDPQPIRDAMQSAADKLRPNGGEELSPIETKIQDVIKRWDNQAVIPMEDALAFHKVVGQAIGDAKRAGDRPAVSRLGDVRAAVDASLGDGLQRRFTDEREAVANGTMKPEDTTEAKLARDDLGEGSPAGTGGQRYASAVGDGQPSVGAAGNPQGEIPVGSSSEATALQGSQGRVGDPVSSPMAGMVRQAAPVIDNNLDIASFLAQRGGIRPNGETRQMSLHTARPGLVRESGMGHDRARQVAVEAGYLNDASGSGPATSDLNDLYDALDSTARGNRVYQYGRRENAIYGSGDAQNDVAMQRARNAVLQTEDDMGGRLSDDEISHAMGLVNDGMHPEDAIRSAAMASEQAFQDLQGRRSATSAGGMPPDATQSTMPLAGGSRLTLADYQPVDTNTRELLGNANAGFRDFAGTYRDGAVGSVLDRTPYGDQKMNLSAVPGAFTKTPEAAQQYFKAAGDSSAAAEAWGDSMALDAFSRPGMIGPDGTLNTGKLQNWLTSNQKVLSVRPDIHARFATLADAAREVEAVQAQRGAVEKDFQARIGKGPDADFAAQAFPADRPMATGAGPVKQYLGNTGATPAALDHLTNQAAATYRAMVMPNGEYLAGMPSRWAARYRGALGALREAAPERAAIFDKEVSARDYLDQQLARHDQAIADYQKSAAGVWFDKRLGGAADPDKAIGSLFAMPHPAKAVAQMAGEMRAAGDVAALNGFKSALYDRTFNSSISKVEKGDDPGIRASRFQDALNSKRDILAGAFSPAEMKTFDGVARELQIGTRMTSGAASFGSPTAKLLYGIKKSSEVKPQSLLSRLAGAVPSAIGAGAGYLAHGSVEGAAGGAVLGTKVGKSLGDYMKARGVAKNEAIKELILGAVTDPTGKGRILLQHATPENTPSLLSALAKRSAQSTMATVGANQVRRFSQH